MLECSARTHTHTKLYTQSFQTKAVTLHFLTFFQIHFMVVKEEHPSVSLSHIITWKQHTCINNIPLCNFISFTSNLQLGVEIPLDGSTEVRQLQNRLRIDLRTSAEMDYVVTRWDADYCRALELSKKFVITWITYDCICTVELHLFFKAVKLLKCCCHHQAELGCLILLNSREHNNREPTHFTFIITR